VDEHSLEESYWIKLHIALDGRPKMRGRNDEEFKIKKIKKKKEKKKEKAATKQ